jgi:hypothetical protein
MSDSHAQDADAAEPSIDVDDPEAGEGAAPVEDESELPHPPPTATEEPDTKPLSETDRAGTPDSPGVG